MLCLDGVTQKTLQALKLKGHGDGEVVIDGDGVEYFEISKGRNVIRSNNLNATENWRTVMGRAGTIYLNGCSTSGLAKSAARVLPGVTGCGNSIPVVGIPWTTCSIGPPSTCYKAK